MVIPARGAIGGTMALRYHLLILTIFLYLVGIGEWLAAINNNPEGSHTLYFLFLLPGVLFTLITYRAFKGPKGSQGSQEQR
jgi:hypothetical protein